MADYVTVDSMLPASSNGQLAYADSGASCTNSANALWIPLIEKAYAEWDQTGNEGRSGVNAYQDIQGGWMATVDAQVLGHNATDYFLTGSTATPEQTAINALAAGEAVTIGTASWWVPANNPYATQDGLYGSHAYAIIGYTASSNTFTLFNPWNCDQPGQLSWGQLQADCTQLCVCNTSGSVPIGGAGLGQFNQDIRVAGRMDCVCGAASRGRRWDVCVIRGRIGGCLRRLFLRRGGRSAAVFQGMENSGEARLHQRHHAARASTVLSPSLVDAALQSLPALV